jgi:membrane-associated phospholipid phosphatase
MQQKFRDTIEWEEEIVPTPVKPVLHAVVKPKTRGEYIAYGISQVGSPPVWGIFALALVTTTLTFSKAWPWLSLYLLLDVLTPLSFLVWQLRRGSITDLDIQLREQRRNTLLVTIGGFALTWLVMLIGGAPPALTLMAGAGMLQWIIIFGITMRWKVSIHSTSATGVAIIILRIFGLSAAPLVVSIPLIAWSRVKLRHHTPAQTIVGVILGVIVSWLAMLLSPAF